MIDISTPQTLVLFYFLATLGFGFYKRSSKDVNSFLFAGRRLTIPALVATLVSTWYGGILEVGRFTYENGIVTWVIFGLFYYIAAFLFVKFMLLFQLFEFFIHFYLSNNIEFVNKKNPN